RRGESHDGTLLVDARIDLDEGGVDELLVAPRAPALEDRLEVGLELLLRARLAAGLDRDRLREVEEALIDIDACERDARAPDGDRVRRAVDLRLEARILDALRALDDPRPVSAVEALGRAREGHGLGRRVPALLDEPLDEVVAVLGAARVDAAEVVVGALERAELRLAAERLEHVDRLLVGAV